MVLFECCNLTTAKCSVQGITYKGIVIVFLDFHNRKCLSESVEPGYTQEAVGQVIRYVSVPGDIQQLQGIIFIVAPCISYRHLISTPTNAHT